jgi:CheY-like chemotaxis protein/DNA-binding CsgD family transcriptional regulator
MIAMNQDLGFDRSSTDLILIVDDVPDNLAVLHDALDESGYTVLVATDGPSALSRAAQAQPDLILLDAVMPGMDGFEVARRLKAEPATATIPIVFMTGLTDTEHVLAAFAAGGTDYVNKPIRVREVLARIATHLHSARAQRQARNALDAFGHATLVVQVPDGRLVWQTALARQLLETHFASDGRLAPPALIAWLQRLTMASMGSLGGAWPGSAPPPSLTLNAGRHRLRFTLHEATGEDQWLLVLREDDDSAPLDALMQAFKLTPREAEVLAWVTRGKTNRDIGDILGSSPATVKKHLEHVYEKLGVETRNAAAAVARGRVWGLTQ